MRRLVPGLVLAALLAGCGDQNPPPEPVNPQPNAVIVNGEHGPVECYVWHHYYAGGVSCNWEAYNDSLEDER